LLIKIDRLRIVTTRGRKDRLYLQWSGRVRFLLAFHCKHKNLTVGTCCKLLRSKNINFKIIFSRHCKVLFNSTADIFKKVIFFFQSLSCILSSFIDIFNLSFFYHCSYSSYFSFQCAHMTCARCKTRYKIKLPSGSVSRW